ncbi:MAG: TIGR02301 family protein [Hyphomicrobiaceae bacterium]|nr:TIGR02301 family protein [Hyphomicrobiaceae bacterium]
MSATLIATAVHSAVAQAPGAVAPSPGGATPGTPGAGSFNRDVKPYDDRLLRLAEILGAIHFLRELCGANDGLLWRERMEELIRAEGPSALRQAKLTRSFNQGYRNYQRTYATCTPTAQTTITRFVSEGQQISDTLLKTIQ